MSIKRCRYSKCHKLLTPFDETFNGCCSKLHEKLYKAEYNEMYYQRTKLNNQIVKHAIIFKTCIDQFGEDTEIEANFLELLGMNWNLETSKFFTNNLDYICIGDYCYILSKNQKVKIIRL